MIVSLGCIVEGDGEKRAAPKLLARIGSRPAAVRVVRQVLAGGLSASVGRLPRTALGIDTRPPYCSFGRNGFTSASVPRIWAARRKNGTAWSGLPSQ